MAFDWLMLPTTANQNICINVACANCVNFIIFSLGANLDPSNCRLPYREVTLNLTPLVAKLMAKYYISFDFRPVAMEISTRHLALCNGINLSGCGWLKPDQTSSSQFDLV